MESSRRSRVAAKGSGKGDGLPQLPSSSSPHSVFHAPDDRLPDQAERREAAGLIAHGARDDFMALLRQRNQVEWEAAIPRKERPEVSNHGVQDMDALMKLLKIKPADRSNADLALIADQIRHSGIFEKLFITTLQEHAVCRILGCRVFRTKGAPVTHEGQTGGSLYFVQEGTLAMLSSRKQQVADSVDNERGTSRDSGEAGDTVSARSPSKPTDGRGDKYVLIANIIEALGVASADKTGSSDPFVTVKFGTKEETSKHCKQTLNPIWDETLRLHDVNSHVADRDSVEVSVWDHDRWGDPDFLGIAVVPLEPLFDDLHSVKRYACNLTEDSRYQAAADEAGVEYQISGTISFSLQLTTESLLAQLEMLQQKDTQAGKGKTYYTAGDFFGDEQLHGGSSPNSVIVEAPTTVLRILGEDYQSQVMPLKSNEEEHKRCFFSELTVFKHLSQEKIADICKWFRIENYKPGAVLFEQGDFREDMAFVMSGEVGVVMEVKTRQEIHGSFHMHGSAHLLAENPLLRQKKAHRDLTLLKNPDQKATKVMMKSRKTKRFFAGSLRRGDTINLLEGIQNEENQYTTIARTPAIILRALKGTYMHPDKGLMEPMRIDSLRTSGNSIISRVLCEELLARCPWFPVGRDLEGAFREQEDWKLFKQRLVSNHVFFTRREHAARGPGRNRFLQSREDVDISGLHPKMKLPPPLPELAETKLMPNTQVLKTLMKEKDTYDEYNGVTMTFKDKLQRIASKVDPPIFSHSEMRPVTPKINYNFDLIDGKRAAPRARQGQPSVLSDVTCTVDPFDAILRPPPRTAAGVPL